MRGPRSFERLVTRLVYRDAAEAYGVLLLAVTFVLVWIERAWRPDEIRAAIADADVTTRALFLGGTMGAYLLATRPVVALLLGSDRLAYLRHLPVSRGRWRRLQGAHLVIVNAPGIAGVVYALAEPELLASWERALVGCAWILLTLAAQTGAVAVAFGWLRCLTWIGASAAVVVAVLARGGGELPPAFADGLWFGLIIASSVFLWRHMGAPPPELDGRQRGFAWGVLRRRGVASPSLALARLQILALLRRAPQRLRRRLWISMATVLIATAATAAAARVGQEVDLWLIRAMLLGGCLVGAEVALLARRLLDRDRWFLDGLPLGSRVEFGAGIGVALLGSGPCALGFALSQLWIGGAAPLSVLPEVVAAPLFATAVMVWIGFRAEARRRLHERGARLPALAFVLGFALLHLSGTAFALLPLTVVALLLGSRAVGPATRVRRRLETVRRDDDHGASL